MIVALPLLGAAVIVGLIAIVHRHGSDASFPPSAGTLGGDKGLRPPR